MRPHVFHPARNRQIACNGQSVSDNFKKWLGNDKAKLVFHASNSVFDSFDISRSDLGAHFGNLEQIVHLESRLSMRGGYNTADGMFVIPVWLRFRNQLRLKDVGSFHADGIALQLERKGLLPKGEGKRITKICEADWLQRKVFDPILRQKIFDGGYDFVVYKNEHEGGGDSFIALDARQIKSAVGNSGLFLKEITSLTDFDEALQLKLAAKALSIAAKSEIDLHVRPCIKARPN